MKEIYYIFASIVFVVGLFTGKAHEEPLLFVTLIVYFMLKAIFFTLLDIKKGVTKPDVKYVSSVRFRDPQDHP